MKIAVIGLGYVGTVSAGCLVSLGHDVIGVDIDGDKVTKMGMGVSPIQEPGLAELIRIGHGQGRLRATTSIEQAVQESDVALLAVGTPSREDGSTDPQYLHTSVREIAEAIHASGKSRYVVMSRSTSPPPVHRELIASLAEYSGLDYESGLAYVCHPEFLREGSAIEDFQHPPKIVFGSHGECRQECDALYPGIEAPTFHVGVGAAAMVKYADNCFHAVKVTFANEVGMVCRELGVDSKEVMELFCSDTKLNISANYFRPGTPFGGSCLRKDLRGMLSLARQHQAFLPMLDGVYRSNHLQVESMVDRILAMEPMVVGIVGLSFKEGTPDLRESPTLALLHRLEGSGVRVVAYDEELCELKRSGLASDASWDGWRSQCFSNLREDLTEVVEEADVLVVHHGLDEDQWGGVDLDSVSILDVNHVSLLQGLAGYDGLYWSGDNTGSTRKAEGSSAT